MDSLPYNLTNHVSGTANDQGVHLRERQHTHTRTKRLLSDGAGDGLVHDTCPQKLRKGTILSLETNSCDIGKGMTIHCYRLRLA